MKYRKLTADGDYVFGARDHFHQDTADGVAQAIRTRLLLWTGEWFLDITEGTAYADQVLGFVAQQRRDVTVQSRIQDTLGVTELTSYSALVDADRRYTVTATVVTAYGQTTLAVTF